MMYLEDSKGDAKNDRIVLLSCLTSTSCQLGFHWVGEVNQPLASGFHLHRPEFISAASGREFIMWTEESTSGADTEVRISTRCPGGAWSSEVHPWSASVGLKEDSQEIEPYDTSPPSSIGGCWMDCGGGKSGRQACLGEAQGWVRASVGGFCDRRGNT
jgi:hypothetical protein